MNEKLNVMNEKIFSKPIVIYGMSIRAVYAYVSLLNRADYEGKSINIVAFCDSKQIEETEEKFCGKEIWSLEQLQRNVGKVNVFIGTNTRAFCYEIVHKLNSMGYRKEDIFHSSTILDINESVAKQYIVNNKEQYEKVYHALADKESREIYENILYYYVKSNRDYIKKAYSISIASGGEKQYFDSKLILGNNEVFVDCGAWIGDTIIDFAEETKSCFEKVYAFEGNGELFPVMNTLLKLKQIRDKVEVYECAVASFNGELKFASNACTGGGRIATDEENATAVKAVKLDDVLANKRVTFIKMDIEGAELEALKGAESLIKENKPKMAICVYHNNAKDLLNVPLYLMEKYPNYRFYIRHYDKNTPSETVLYCI